MQERQIPFMGREDPLEKEMATHSSILENTGFLGNSWEFPWTEEPSRLQSIGSQESDMTKQQNNNNTSDLL